LVINMMHGQKNIK